MSKKAYLVLSLLVLVALTAGSTLVVQADRPAQAGPKEDIAKLEQFWQQGHGKPPHGGPNVSLPLGLSARVLAKAEPDECFAGIGNCPYGEPDKHGRCQDGVPKVNEAYVWGLTKSGDNIWFGTAPNVHCLVIGGFLGMTGPIQTDSYVCEFGDSCVAKDIPALPAAIGDWRPPNIYTYDTKTKKLVVKSPPDQRLQYTLGLRSAGTLGKVVFLGGPGLPAGVNLFAFNAETGEYIGSASLPYSNIRKWLVVDGVLYTGVGKVGGRGAVLRWRGDPNNPTIDNVFSFDEVGDLDGDAAELALRDGRLFVSAWGGSPSFGIHMSPVIPAGGLTSAHASQWTTVWRLSDFDPDPVTAAVDAGGALASYDGYLYWGTMHVPFLAALAHSQVYGPPASQEEFLATVLGTHRAISIFRGRDFGTDKEKIEVVYGDPLLPAYIDGQWQIVPNKMGRPLYGPSGFGNFFNNYTWTMSVYDNKLFVGTMDWSYLAGDMLKTLVQQQTGSPMTQSLNLPAFSYGADLFAFVSSNLPAIPISTDGVGNYTSYGIRNSLSADQAMYLGMANPMNLLTNTKDKIPEGGWELIRVSAK